MIEQGVYRHYKGGFYTVLMIARCSDNGPNEGEKVVVYVSHTTGKVCTRLMKDFSGELVDPYTNITVKRFVFIASGLSIEKVD